ncbi:MAG: Dabb family protein [Acidobacteria bacterium]|nr:Dabb family protein [Acidobacteriota bacterium]
MIRHIVIFKFKPEVSQTDRNGFLEMLRALPSKISEIIDFEAGFDVVRSARAFDLALVSTYADLAALDRYAKHEHHLPVIARSKEICEQIASVDFEC